MNAKIKVEKDVEIKTLHVQAGVRYWEDATVDGVEDTEGNLIPCREHDLWKPIIDIDNGVILNWKKGTIAKIHYKVCDAGSYFLKDKEGNTIAAIEDNYVPEILCPGGVGFGDYIIMDVAEDGTIENWDNTGVEDFLGDEE